MNLAFLDEWKRAYKKERNTAYRVTPNDMDSVNRADKLGTLKGLDMADFCRRAVSYLEHKKLTVSMRAAVNSVNEIVDMGRNIIEMPVFDGEAFRTELEDESDLQS